MGQTLEIYPTQTQEDHFTREVKRVYEFEINKFINYINYYFEIHDKFVVRFISFIGQYHDYVESKLSLSNYVKTKRLESFIILCIEIYYEKYGEIEKRVNRLNFDRIFEGLCSPEEVFPIETSSIGTTPGGIGIVSLEDFKYSVRLLTEIRDICEHKIDTGKGREYYRLMDNDNRIILSYT